MKDTSQVVTFRQCPRAYTYQYIEQIRKVEQLNLPMDWGSHVHALLAKVYGKEVESLYTDTPGEQLYTLANAREVVNQYKEYAKLNDDWDVLGVEKILSIPSISSDFVVKPDLIVVRDDGIYGVDHKTSKKDYRWAKFERVDQIAAQIRGITHSYGSCEGVIINGITVEIGVKPKLLDPDDPARNEYENVAYAYSKYYKKEMAYCSGLRVRFQRQVFERTPKQMAVWEEDMRGWIKRIEQGEKGMADQLCSWCQYVDLCLSAHDEQVKESMYEKYDAYAYLKGGVDGKDA